MKNEIEKITIITGNGTKEYKVGEKEIGEIHNISFESEDNMTIIYTVFDEWENPIASIENCPVFVEYKRL